MSKLPEFFAHCPTCDTKVYALSRELLSPANLQCPNGCKLKRSVMLPSKQLPMLNTIPKYTKPNKKLADWQPPKKSRSTLQLANGELQWFLGFKNHRLNFQGMRNLVVSERTFRLLSQVQGLQQDLKYALEEDYAKQKDLSDRAKAANKSSKQE